MGMKQGLVLVLSLDVRRLRRYYHRRMKFDFLLHMRLNMAPKMNRVCWKSHIDNSHHQMVFGLYHQLKDAYRF